MERTAPPVFGARSAILVLALLASGCGSVIGTQARAATIAAVATHGVARVVEQSAAADAAAACPREQYAPRSPELSACLAPLRERWAPADVAVASTRAALVAWTEALDVARLAGDDGMLWPALAVMAARLVFEYGRLADALRPLGVEVPALPDTVTWAAHAVGGEGP